VVQQGLRAGVASYSLKQIEALTGFERRADLKSGTGAVLAYERWMDARENGAPLERIAAYNEEDCRATLALRDWLVANRPPNARWAGVSAAAASEDAGGGEREALQRALVDGEEPGSPRWLAGHLLEYHRREARPAWWWFFERCEHMTVEELVDDAEAIGDLVGTGAPIIDARSLVYTLKFPPQQHKLAVGDQPYDPATKKPAGTIVALDDPGGTLKLKRGPTHKKIELPRALIPGGPVQTKEQRGALARLASSILADDGRYPALRDILARTPPRVQGCVQGGRVQTIDLAEQRALAAALDGSYLFIQGPPGTGKTWTGARLITELMRRGRRVGVAATSHKAIHNLLDEVEKAAAEEGLRFRGLKKSSGNDESAYEGKCVTSAKDVAAFARARPDVLLFAGTAWLFAHASLDGGAQPMIDTLVVDEAGQVSLADALAMGTAARNVVLLGDPLQLAQVSQGTHPPGTEKSVLEHLLGDHPTIPPDKGVFLERTRRMHPAVCGFISEVVYESRLAGIPELARQTTAFGAGLRFRPVEHSGNQSASIEEAAAVAGEIGKMVGGSWTDRDGATRPLRQKDFMVVAPYNAQVRRLREALKAARLTDVAVGTVDKFQGREAPVVVYSMATSSAADVPRTLDFLFSRNRLNVAVSRAMCLAFVVASPLLLESRARTIEQMRLINALCRFVDLADAQGR
jgi:uncharacterized protein